MSCGCNDLSKFPRTCGVDPCLVHKTSTDLVFYTGDALSCSEIQKCDNTTLALQKIDTKLCPESITNSIITAIQNNPSLQNIFCTLVNECIPTTTSSSTTATPCYSYELENTNSEVFLPYLYFDCEKGGEATFSELEPLEIKQVCSLGQIFAHEDITVTQTGLCI